MTSLPAGTCTRIDHATGPALVRDTNIITPIRMAMKMIGSTGSGCYQEEEMMTCMLDWNVGHVGSLTGPITAPSKLSRSGQVRMFNVHIQSNLM